MQIHCAACGRVVTLVATGVLPARCPHCAERPVPERIGDCTIERLLAAGGMGEVYLARRGPGQEEVALKLLPPPVAEDVQALRERFAREARLQAAVDHPGVVPVLACDVLGDRPYLVLEYVRGRSVRELLKTGPVPVAEVVRICADVACVLAAAHEKGVLHRDVKPENVLVGEDGRVRVLDFGIARARDGEAPVTRTGEIVGTPQYMAPEQLLDAGEEVDERCDVHALGVLAHEMLTGEAPFQGANVFAVLKLVESLVPRPPSATRPEVPAAVDAVVQKALAKDRDQRWASAAEFAEALRAAEADDAVTPGAPPGPGRRRAVLAGGSVVLLLLLATWLAWPDGSMEPFDDSPVLQPPTAAEVRAARRAYGRELLQRGEYFAAAVELDGLGGEALADARLAWLCAYELLPLCAEAPRHWARCDDQRRDRLFGRSPDLDGELDEPDAVALLAHGRPADAWQALRAALARPVADRPAHTATLGVLAAHLACRDRRVLRAVTQRLSDAAPAVLELLQARLLPISDRTGRREVLRARAQRLPTTGPDHWLCSLLATGLEDDAAADDSLELAKQAWLHGAGEAATIWWVGSRLRQARRAATTLPPDEVARLRKLLSGAATAEAPSVLMLELLLDLQHGNAAQLLEAGIVLPDPLAPSLEWIPAWTRAARSRSNRHAMALADVVARGKTAGPAYLHALRGVGGSHVRRIPQFALEPPTVLDAITTSLSELAPEAAAERFSLLALLASAGVEPGTTEPWTMLAEEPWRTRWLEEVCGGVQ